MTDNSNTGQLENKLEDDSMVTIPVISDVHVFTIQLGVLSYTHLWGDVQYDFMDYSKDAKDNPEMLASDGYWNGLYDLLETRANQNPKLRREGVKEKHQKILDESLPLVKEQLNILKTLFSGHLDVMGGGDYDQIYAEGEMGGRYQVIADQKGIDLVMLDVDNPYFGLCPQPHQEHEVMSRKEDFWLERISTTGKPLLFLGYEHVNNRYGLVEKLNELGVTMNIIQDSTEQGERCKALNDQIQTIKLNYS
jgi:hypothetical protein